ncbi:hypothetical protein K466DRAFT_656880 [Polyporus arcularius HHB13444]|uniref:Uncharacterized protein n=1 Tax=Polyporus arcularius HHB13444 TaxID=1314778 RepID=A0A5C3NSY8_9APHY|nr:hypothetical protein K466DRAFT_656880 [Polyporus arcularius HHB13444]
MPPRSVTPGWPWSSAHTRAVRAHWFYIPNRSRGRLVYIALGSPESTLKAPDWPYRAVRFQVPSCEYSSDLGVLAGMLNAPETLIPEAQDQGSAYAFARVAAVRRRLQRCVPVPGRPGRRRPCTRKPASSVGRRRHLGHAEHGPRRMYTALRCVEGRRVPGMSSRLTSTACACNVRAAGLLAFRLARGRTDSAFPCTEPAEEWACIVEWTRRAAADVSVRGVSQHSVLAQSLARRYPAPLTEHVQLDKIHPGWGHRGEEATVGFAQCTAVSPARSEHFSHIPGNVKKYIEGAVLYMQ